jgi:hypothetical protein
MLWIPGTRNSRFPVILQRRNAPQNSLLPLFNIQDPDVWKSQSKTQKKSRRAHRPLTFSSEQGDAVVTLTEGGHPIGNFTGQGNVLPFVEFGKCVTYSWVDPLLARNESRVCRTIVSPQEQTRLQVSRAFSDQYIPLIKE